MVKIILLIVFSVLAIAAYILCKLMKEQNPVVSMIMAGVSVAMLIAVIICSVLIKVDDGKEKQPTNGEPVNVEGTQNGEESDEQQMPEDEPDKPLELDNGKSEDENIEDKSDKEEDSKEEVKTDDSGNDNKGSSNTEDNDSKNNNKLENKESEDKDSEGSKVNNEA